MKRSTACERFFRSSIPLAGEFGAGVNDAKALALEISLRAARRLSDAHRQIAAGSAARLEAGGNQGCLRAAPAVFLERAHSEKAGDSLPNSEGSSTDRFSIHPDQVRHETRAGEEFLDRVDQVFGRLEMVGETARNCFGEETRFGWFCETNRDTGRDGRKLLSGIDFANQHVGKFEHAIPALSEHFDEPGIDHGTDLDENG